MGPVTLDQISRTMLLAGVVCGLINFCVEIKRRRDANSTALAEGKPVVEPLDSLTMLMTALASIGTSLVAAFLVPLFLNATSSKLIMEVTTPGTAQTTSYWVFFGFCFLAAFVPNPFITGLSTRVLAQKANENATDAKNKAADASHKAEDARHKAGDADARAAVAGSKATDAGSKADAADDAARSAAATAKSAADTAKVASDKAASLETQHTHTKQTLVDLTSAVTEPETLKGPESLMSFDVPVRSGLSADEQKVLGAFANSRFIWRSSSGIAGELKMEPAALQPILDSLALQGVIERVSRPEGERWKQVSKPVLPDTASETFSVRS